MKKALAFLMAAVMLMSMLTACGNKDNNDVNTEKTDKAPPIRSPPSSTPSTCRSAPRRPTPSVRPPRRLGCPDRRPEGAGGG